MHVAALADIRLPGTDVLVPPKDVVAEQFKQVRDYFLRRIADARKTRDERWRPDVSSVAAYAKWIEPQRWRFRGILGLTAERPTSGKARVETVADVPGCRIERITIPMSDGLSARGLLFSPKTPGRHGVILACPDADRWPEAFSGLSGDGLPPAWLTDLIERNAIVYVPQSIERLQDHPYCKTTNGKDRRWILYRLGYVVGRTMPGLDVQDVMAAMGHLAGRRDVDASRIGIAGIGQGGMTALYVAALDRRVAAVAAADYFQQRDRCWREPVDRRLPGQLLAFGDAELAAMIAPRPLAVVRSLDGGVPEDRVRAESARAAVFYKGISAGERLTFVANATAWNLESQTVSAVANALGLSKPAGPSVDWQVRVPGEKADAIRNKHFEERLAYLRHLIDASDAKRQRRWGITTRDATDFPKVRERMLENHRQLVGQVPDEKTPLNPRTQLVLITDKYKAYRVMLDVVKGVQVYGNLLIPRGIKGRVPAVICQHGLSGTPEMITGLGQDKDTPYHAFGRHLAERGYVVFAPLILHHHPVEHVNEQVRMADAIGMMRIAMPIAKANRVIDFLETQDCVDPKRIGYYGLSYGGYSAIWMAPLLDRLAATVVSGHFNDWRSKITTDQKATSYLRHPDEDFYNWDILHRFTHPELIAMTAPRPACIEFGERDGITTPEWTAYAWKQVVAIRDHLGLTDRIQLAHYDGVHEIHGVETFDFLDRFLMPERPVGRDYEYTLRAAHGPGRINALSQVQTKPLITHILDSRGESWIRGRFWMPTGARELWGMAVKLSRVGHPGTAQVRFGSRPGGNDLGVATIGADSALPLFEHWYELRLPAKPPAARSPVYYELRCATGKAPADHYRVYGPCPIGGRDFPDRFGLSYRVLTDRPQDAVDTPGKEHRFAHIRRMLSPYDADDPSRRFAGKPAGPNETCIDKTWTILHTKDDDAVLQAAARDLQRFLATRAQMQVRLLDRAEKAGAHTIRLTVRRNKEIEDVTSDEGYRVEVRPDRIVIAGRTARGVMRGVYWLEDMMRFRDAPCLARGTTVRNCRFDRRITCSVVPGGSKYIETSQPLLYTDGLLQRISHQGFNGVWIWLNMEEATFDSKVFPELNDKEAVLRFARLNDVIGRARRFGIDVYCYFSMNCHHPVPNAFYKKHPDAKGVGWGNAMCPSNDNVLAYYGETVRGVFARVPGLRGLCVIFDSEGLYHCGTSDGLRKRCPRCKHRTCDQISLGLLTALNDAVRSGGPDKELIVWPYGPAGAVMPWVRKLIGQLPKNMIFQALFSKGTTTEKDGIKHVTGDYNISTLGPPAHFVEQYNLARKAGLRVTAKTEHAVSQEFITVPYIPCLQQWYRRVKKMSEYQLDGFWGNWCHYGYTPSRPAEILMWYSWTDAPPIDELLLRMARRDFGAAAAKHAVNGWEHFTRGIQHFPYSDPVARTPGPLQKGPSQPLFLDPKKKVGLPWRSWQNDLKWARPWGPAGTAKHLGLLEKEFAAGIADFEKARQHASDPTRKADLDDELGIARMIRASVHTILNLIRWVPVRDAYAKTPPGKQREELRRKLIEIGRDELANARAALRVAEADSRLGASSEGGGMQPGGLFTPSLIRHKIGLLEDVLIRQLGADRRAQADP